MKAQHTVEKLLKSMLGSRGFASPESTVSSLMDAMEAPSDHATEIAEHILEDFSLTQKVLKLANSPMYAPIADEAANVSQALKILGSDALMHVVLSTPTLSDSDLAADSALSNSKLSSELARSVMQSRAEDVSIATLMYNLGNMLLEKYLPTEAAALAKLKSEGQSEDEAATSVLGLTVPELGAQIAQRWKLPNSVVSIINGTGDPDLIAIAKFANSASSLIRNGKLDDVDVLVKALDVPGMDRSALSMAIQKNSPKVEVATNGPKRTGGESVLGDLYSDLIQEKASSMESLAGAMFPTIVETLQAAHCLFFMKTRHGDWAIRFGYGKGLDEIRSKLRLSKEYKPTAFHASIMNNVDVSIADTSRLKPTALPEGFKELLPKVNKFVILPVANSSVSGLLYCDWDSENALTPQELEVLKKLRGLFLPFCPP